MASAASLASPFPSLLSGLRTALCYCHCEYETRAKHCTMMCELPQYESRWWANSCHKKSPQSKPAEPQAPNSGSRKTNYTEEARR
jgi:hypothetical protein